MTTLLEAVRTRRRSTPKLRSISWRSAGEMVQISVEVINDSSERTAPDTLVIEAAAFGAFVPNVPVARTAVGGLDPGEEREVTTTVSRTALDAIAQGGPLETPRGRTLSTLNAARGTQWVGNLNVYFETAPEHAIERHRAFDLEVPAGEVVAACFFAMDENGCTFHTRCSDGAWSAEVHTESPWCAFVFVRTPDDPGKRAKVIVDVTRTRDGKVVPVEFEFHTVSGPGEKLGCVTV